METRMYKKRLLAKNKKKKTKPTHIHHVRHEFMCFMHNGLCNKSVFTDQKYELWHSSIADKIISVAFRFAVFNSSVFIGKVIKPYQDGLMGNWKKKKKNNGYASKPESFPIFINSTWQSKKIPFYEIYFLFVFMNLNFSFICKCFLFKNSFQFNIVERKWVSKKRWN